MNQMEMRVNITQLPATLNPDRLMTACVHYRYGRECPCCKWKSMKHDMTIRELLEDSLTTKVPRINDSFNDGAHGWYGYPKRGDDPLFYTIDRFRGSFFARITHPFKAAHYYGVKHYMCTSCGCKWDSASHMLQISECIIRMFSKMPPGSTININKLFHVYMRYINSVEDYSDVSEDLWQYILNENPWIIRTDDASSYSYPSTDKRVELQKDST